METILHDKRDELVYLTKISRMLLGALILLVCLQTQADPGGVTCYPDFQGCAMAAQHQLTRQFQEHFPAEIFKIVVLTEYQPSPQRPDGVSSPLTVYGNTGQGVGATPYDSGGVGVAIVGISPVSPDGVVQLPIKRYIQTVKTSVGQGITHDTERMMLQLVQDAVHVMMVDCERTPACDVYAPYPIQNTP